MDDYLPDAQKKWNGALFDVFSLLRGELAFKSEFVLEWESEAAKNSD